MEAKRQRRDPAKFHWLAVDDAARRVAAWPKWKREYRLTTTERRCRAHDELANQENNTMWYESDKKDELDYSKPIAAFRKDVIPDCNEFLLMRRNTGYAWFNVKKGNWGTGVYISVHKAVTEFTLAFDIQNVNIILEPVS